MFPTKDIFCALMDLNNKKYIDCSKLEYDIKETLHEEKMMIRIYMDFKKKPAAPPAICRKKNAKDSISYRIKGNKIYGRRIHDDLTHEEVWRLYTKSVALAPNDSEELALAYGNRSALLFHLEKYDDCVKDCDRAIEITSSHFLKCKLLSRKAECLAALKNNAAESACEDALKSFSDLPLGDDVKRKFLDKLHNLLNTIQNSKSIDKNSSNKKNWPNLYDFPRQKEVPCASDAIKINYNEKWGRHTTTTRNIKAGEILAIEKTFYQFIQPEGMYLFCSNCAKPTWSSIPCSDCIYDIYCSTKCKSEAWEIYHQFECPVYPYLWDIDEDISVGQCSMRLLFRAVYQSGGIENMKKIIEEIEDNQDPRTKGFSDGVFLSDCAKSLYSLMSKRDESFMFAPDSLIQHVCTNVYLIATKTNFFGHKFDMKPSKLFKNDDILFIAALLYKTFNVIPRNAFKLSFEVVNQFKWYSLHINIFCSLLNHSCSSNADLFLNENNEVVLFATDPIEEGSQVFLNYMDGSFLNYTCEKRREYLADAFYFDCSCQACEENWSNICVPSIVNILETTPVLIPQVECIIYLTMQIQPYLGEKQSKYNPAAMDHIMLLLDCVSKITVVCADYIFYKSELKKILTDYFGYWMFNISSECSSYIQD